MSDYADEIAAREMPHCECDIGRDYVCHDCFNDYSNGSDPKMDSKQLARIIREAVAAEREACAKECKAVFDIYSMPILGDTSFHATDEGAKIAALACEERIRARGET